MRTDRETRLEAALLEYIERYGFSNRARDLFGETPGPDEPRAEVVYVGGKGNRVLSESPASQAKPTPHDQSRCWPPG